MFKKVKIVDSGSSILRRRSCRKRIIDLENKRLIEQKVKTPIKYEPIIQGITKAAVNTGSFISAASFPRNNKVLSNAAIER